MIIKDWFIEFNKPGDDANYTYGAVCETLEQALDIFKAEYPNGILSAIWLLGVHEGL